MEQTGKIRGWKQVTDNRFLNYFEIEAVNRKGESFPYYMASRARTGAELRMNQRGKAPDGVAIFSLYGERRDRVVLIRQFRYPTGEYVYEFPAGLVEAGEEFHAAAAREMKEETGLTFHGLQADPMFEKPFYMTDGMTDEACSMVYGYAEGTVSSRGLEAGENIEVVLADEGEIRRILREEPLALSCAFMLMQFLANPKDPFRFLKA